MPKSGKSPYGPYGVYGSLAYDFKPIGNERPGQYSAAKAGTKPRAAKRKRTAASPAVAVGAVLCALIFSTGLLLRAETVELSHESVEMQNEIEELLDEQTFLKIRHAAAFSPEETERYATEELGMQKPGAHQIYYIDIPELVIEDGDGETHLPWKLLSMLREYLPG